MVLLGTFQKINVNKERLETKHVLHLEFASQKEK